MIVDKYLYLNSRDELYRLDINCLAYFEGDGNYTNFYLLNGKKGTVLMNLLQMQNLLSKSLQEDARIFARIGKSLIVNLNYVYRISIARQKVVLTDGKQPTSFELHASREALINLKALYVTEIVKGSKKRPL